MKRLLETIILGLIQGLTEWLPISSTGHLRLAEHFLGLKVPMLFDVALHVGTLIVVLFFFKSDVRSIIHSAIHIDFKTEAGRTLLLAIVGTIPTALIGLLFGESIEIAFQDIFSVAAAFVACGIMLYSIRFAKEKSDNISYSTALFIGVAQGLATIPGISRSGATIAVALLLGVKREKAFKFSFILSIPAIIGAFVLTAYKGFDALISAGLGWGEIIAGASVAMFIGYFALKLLWRILRERKFHFFAFYCWLLGAALIALGLCGF
ncbi:MAG: undecaprenyl-diphosphate phosphatase [Candidatus Bathyarchaeia archaeon]